LYRLRGSDAARALVACNLAGLGVALAGIGPLPALPPGHLDPDACLLIRGQVQGRRLRIDQPPRRLERNCGEAARAARDPIGERWLTEMVAIARRADGTTLRSARLYTSSPTRSGPFTLRLPLDDDCETVQFRHQAELFAVQLTAQPAAVRALLSPVGDQAVGVSLRGSRLIDPGAPSSVAPWRPLPYLRRPPGQPSVQLTHLGDGILAWRYDHSRGSLPRVEVEVGNGSIWRRGLLADDGADRGALDLTRLGPGLQARAVRLVASDGWNSAEDTLDAERLRSELGFVFNPRELLIRRYGAHHYWIDCDLLDDELVVWRLGPGPCEAAIELGEHRVDSVIEVGPEHSGRRLVVQDGNGRWDSIVVGPIDIGTLPCSDGQNRVA
jgi:hypothetical protein